MQFWSLKGLIPYEAARELQQRLVDLRARDLIEDTILFLEHEPVITQGRGLQRASGGTAGERVGHAKASANSSTRHMPRPALLPPEIAFCETERGGDLTYHGPGQLVIYPICKLDGEGFAPRHDIAAFLRKLESVFIEELGSLGLCASAREGATGVWVEESTPGQTSGSSSGSHSDSASARKIASMGIAVRKWVSYHGIAINIVNDLKPFHLISPCGFSPEVMTRLVDLVEIGVIPDEESGSWRTWFESRLASRLASQLGSKLDKSPGVETLSLEDALAQSHPDAQASLINLSKPSSNVTLG